MIVKNIKTKTEFSFTLEDALKLRKFYKEDFEFVPENEEEKKLLIEEKKETLTIEEKILGKKK